MKRTNALAVHAACILLSPHPVMLLLAPLAWIPCMDSMHGFMHLRSTELPICFVMQVGMDREQLAIAHTREIYDPTAAFTSILQHPLQLQSAYVEVTGAEPEFTSCHDRFYGTVDYIWFTPQVSCKLTLLQLITSIHV